MNSFFCPNCGSAIGDGDTFCLSCGAKLSTTQEQAKSGTQQQNISVPQAGHIRDPVKQKAWTDPARFPNLRAGIFTRFLALIIDGFVISLLIPVLGIGFIYMFFKESFPGEGKSVGKSMLNLKVVDFATGNPASTGQIFLRNLCLVASGGLDIFLALCNSDQRRIGDLIANTIVIEDK